jgi:hypothetical protein
MFQQQDGACEPVPWEDSPYRVILQSLTAAQRRYLFEGHWPLREDIPVPEVDMDTNPIGPFRL